jgi:hypothetical protein
MTTTAEIFENFLEASDQGYPIINDNIIEFDSLEDLLPNILDYCETYSASVESFEYFEGDQGHQFAGFKIIGEDKFFIFASYWGFYPDENKLWRDFVKDGLDPADLINKRLWFYQ